MEPVIRLSLGAATAQCYDTALADWRRRYANSTSVQDLYAGPVASSNVSTSMYPQGRVHIVVTILGRRRTDDETYFYKFHRFGDDQLEFVRGSVDLD